MWVLLFQSWPWVPLRISCLFRSHFKVISHIAISFSSHSPFSILYARIIRFFQLSTLKLIFSTRFISPSQTHPSFYLKATLLQRLLIFPYWSTEILDAFSESFYCSVPVSEARRFIEFMGMIFVCSYFWPWALRDSWYKYVLEADFLRILQIRFLQVFMILLLWVRFSVDSDNFFQHFLDRFWVQSLWIR